MSGCIHAHTLAHTHTHVEFSRATRGLHSREYVVTVTSGERWQSIMGRLLLKLPFVLEQWSLQYTKIQHQDGCGVGGGLKERIRGLGRHTLDINTVRSIIAKLFPARGQCMTEKPTIMSTSGLFRFRSNFVRRLSVAKCLPPNGLPGILANPQNKHTLPETRPIFGHENECYHSMQGFYSF